MNSQMLTVIVTLTLGGCAATTLNPYAARVMVTKTAAPAGCVYLGSVVGEQGGSLTGKYTSNANLAEGAFNDMKNKAYALGANYVVLENTQAGNTQEGSNTSFSGGQTDVTHVGNAFKCPESAVPGIAPIPGAPVVAPAGAPVAAPPVAPPATPQPPQATRGFTIIRL
jgi:uncharacterized protein YbjQ (UPF0145 family)